MRKVKRNKRKQQKVEQSKIYYSDLFTTSFSAFEAIGISNDIIGEFKRLGSIDDIVMNGYVVNFQALASKFSEATGNSMQLYANKLAVLEDKTFSEPRIRAMMKVVEADESTIWSAYRECLPVLADTELDLAKHIEVDVEIEEYIKTLSILNEVSISAVELLNDLSVNLGELGIDNKSIDSIHDLVSEVGAVAGDAVKNISGDNNG
jgi:hypothetical protein